MVFEFGVAVRIFARDIYPVEWLWRCNSLLATLNYISKLTDFYLNVHGSFLMKLECLSKLTRLDHVTMHSKSNLFVSQSAGNR